MSRRLFGTDGIRGVAGNAPLDCPTVSSFGRALGEWASSHESRRVVLGMDTRESGPELAGWVAAGLSSAGVETLFAGVTTTPGIAYLTRTEDFSAGVMISASHNPYQDNGLKAFAHTGYKLPDEDELQLERRIFELLASPAPVQAPARLPLDSSFDQRYSAYLLSTSRLDLGGRKIVLDCAHGGSSRIAPEIFRRLGAQVIETGCQPDGRNINDRCGALHVSSLRERVLAEGAAFGAAFDGDADRCILVSGSGKIIDGDHSLLIAGRRSHPGAVVATVMSNLGLERALASSGIALIRTSVGDRYVLEEMLRLGLPLGGEQSGHVIFREFATTGDGLLTALKVIETAVQSCATLDDLTRDFIVYPQRLVNVRFKVKRALEHLDGVQREIRATEDEFGSAGRVLVRFSGTEPLARVMVEGPALDRVEDRARRIAAAIESELS